MSYPKATVLMPIYKDRSFLSFAIESILNQTFKNFEFLIISEYGTSDETISIVNSYHDERIVFIQNPHNMGITKSLNLGLDLARGEYIARMDDDDASHLNRLEKQIKFMDANPQIGVCGSWIRMIGGVFGCGDSECISKFPESHDGIKIELLLRNPLAHPTVMLRRSYMEKYALRYNENILAAEDYELWSRAIHCFKFANIADILLDYRMHATNACKIHSKALIDACKLIMVNQIKTLGVEPTEKEIDLHYAIASRSLDISGNNYSSLDINQWFDKLIAANSKTLVYDQEKFKNFLTGQWFNPLKLCKNTQQVKAFLCRSFKNPKYFVNRIWYVIKCFFFYIARLRHERDRH